MKTLISRLLTLAIGTLAMLWLMMAGQAVRAQQSQGKLLEAATHAVVHIVARQCTPTGCTTIGSGNGALISPDGLIVTAWDVTVVKPTGTVTQTLIYPDYFVIEVLNDVKKAPQPLYRAHVAAVLKESDLALLQIDQTAAGEPLTSPPALPTLPLAQQIPNQGLLRIIGYSAVANSLVSYPGMEQSGFDEDGGLLKVQGQQLSESYLGAPALTEQNGEWQVVGVVLKPRGTRGEVGLIRNIQRLQHLTWRPEGQRAWGEKAAVNVRMTENGKLLQVRADIHLFDLVNQRVQLLAYAYDTTTQQPWPADMATQPHSPNGQLVLQQELQATHFVETLTGVTLLAPLGNTDQLVEKVAFRLLVWDVERAQAIWQSSGWLQPQPLNPSTSATPVPLTATNTPTPPLTPTSDLSIEPLVPPADEATKQAESFTPTPSPPPTANQTATEDARLATAVAATLTAAAPPTATATPNYAATETQKDRLATAVAATLTAAVPPTPTPNLGATQTRLAEDANATVQAAVQATQAEQARQAQVATAIAATLTAQAPPTPDLAATVTENARQLAVMKTRMAQQTPNPTATRRSTPVPPTATTGHGLAFTGTLEKQCHGEAGNTWFDGYIFVNNRPVNGYKIVFKSRKVPGKEPVTPPQISGPHEGYKDWPAGYYAHIVSAGFVQRSLEIWLIDDRSNPISNYVNWDTDGPNGPCNKAVINFYAP